MKYYITTDLKKHLSDIELENYTSYYEITLKKIKDEYTLKEAFLCSKDKKEKVNKDDYNKINSYIKTLSKADFIYLNQLKEILKNGTLSKNRTGIDTLSIFGTQNKYDLSKSFPLLTTKKTVLRNIVSELIWFIQGDTDLNYLKEKNNPIWNQWRRPYNTNRELVRIKTRLEDEYIKCIYTKEQLLKEINRNDRLFASEIDLKLYKIWANLMTKSYLGLSGDTLSEDWQNPDTFIKEVKKIPHWYYKESDWTNIELSNKYYNSKVYSKDTSVWLSKEENTKYLIDKPHIKVSYYEGNVEIFYNYEDFYKKYNSNIKELLKRDYNSLNPTEKRIFEKFELAKIDEFKTNGNEILRYKLIANDDMGPIYGYNWRQFDYVDQLSNIINEIKKNPMSRRLIISAWNPKEIDNMALPPCHTMFQFNVTDGRLDCQLYQRSADFPIGVPFNIASYALLVYLIAKECNLEPGEFIHTTGDTHIYINQIEAIKEQLKRLPYPAPQLSINNWNGIYNFKPEDVELKNYISHGFLKMPVAK